jgi:MFS transporter, FSR family, fosmidomycin resistance protein
MTNQIRNPNDERVGPRGRSHVTLALSTILHGFTHAYGSMLVPLYYRIADDLKLPGVGRATLIVTIYGAVYNLGSYGAGLAADRFSRKKLLAIGLLGNALAIGGIGLCRDYWGILALGVAAGIFGTIFHPSANALASSHYPKSPGMAIGILGIGSGLGFFFGPLISGWRARDATWHLWNVAQWQKPCLEMAIVGLVVGVIFILFGTDPHGPHPNPPPEYQGRGNRGLSGRVVRMALVLMFRDFAGVAGLSLAAIYVRNVFHLNVSQAGLFVGVMMLPSVIFNPLSVYLTPGRRRLPGLSVILIVGGLAAATTPLWPLAGALVILCVFQTLQLASYAVSDGATFERVAPEFRGRVSGLFLQIAGTFGALGPWVMGAWTDRLPAAHVQSSYFALYAVIGVSMIVAAAGPRLIGRLGPVVARVDPMREISPETMGAVP